MQICGQDGLRFSFGKEKDNGDNSAQVTPKFMSIEMPCKYKNVALTVVDIGQGSADQSTRLETYVKKIRTSKSKSNKKSQSKTLTTRQLNFNNISALVESNSTSPLQTKMQMRILTSLKRMKSEKSKSLNKVGRICSAITMSSFKPNKSNEIKQRSHSIKYLSMTGQQLLDSPRRIIKAKRKVPLIFTNDLSSEGTSVSEDTPQSQKQEQKRIFTDRSFRRHAPLLEKAFLKSKLELQLEDDRVDDQFCKPKTTKNYVSPFLTGLRQAKGLLTARNKQQINFFRKPRTNDKIHDLTNQMAGSATRFTFE